MSTIAKPQTHWLLWRASSCGEGALDGNSFLSVVYFQVRLLRNRDVAVACSTCVRKQTSCVSGFSLCCAHVSCLTDFFWGREAHIPFFSFLSLNINKTLKMTPGVLTSPSSTCFLTLPCWLSGMSGCWRSAPRGSSGISLVSRGGSRSGVRSRGPRVQSPCTYKLSFDLRQIPLSLSACFLICILASWECCVVFTVVTGVKAPHAVVCPWLSPWAVEIYFCLVEGGWIARNSWQFTVGPLWACCPCGKHCKRQGVFARGNAAWRSPGPLVPKQRPSELVHRFGFFLALVLLCHDL